MTLSAGLYQIPEFCHLPGNSGDPQDLHRETISYLILPSREHHWIWRFRTDTNPALTHMLIQQVADSGKKTSGRMSKHLFCAT